MKLGEYSVPCLQLQTAKMLECGLPIWFQWTVHWSHLPGLGKEGKPSWRQWLLEQVGTVDIHPSKMGKM